jgi:16S rRNA (guanine966-N2)-methyltransferase
MRIIGGQFRGRALVSPDGQTTRPTSDRAREAIFNILNHADWCPRLTGMRVMDVFAGSGALGLEALSHGADYCLFVDHDREAQKAIAANVKTLGIRDKTQALNIGFERLGNRPSGESAFDLVFMDPPYHKGLGLKALDCLDTGKWLKDDAIIVLERGKGEGYFATEVWEIINTKIYGIAEVLFLRKKFI